MSASDQSLNLRYTLDIANVETNAKAMAKAIVEAEKATIQLAETNKRLKRSYDEALNTTKKIPQTQKQIANTSKQATTAAKQQTKSVEELTLSWKSFERYLAASIARRAVYQILSGIREGLREAIELNKRIAEIRTISQDNTRTTAAWAQGLREVSDAFGLDILDTAESAYQALSNQVVNATEALEFLETTSEFAITTLSTQADAVNLVSSAIKSFNLEANDAEYVAASFFKTIELGRVRSEEMANTLGRVSVLLGQLGGDLDDLNAFTAVATVQGLKYTEASTQLRGVLNSLIKPTDAMKVLIRDLGFESGQAAIEGLGFRDLLIEMAKYIDGNAELAAKLVPRIRGLTGLLSVVRDSGIEYAGTLDKIRDAQESYLKATAIATETAGRQLDIALTRIKNYFTKDLGLDAVDALATFNKEVVRFDLLVQNATTAVGYLAAGLAILSLANPFVRAVAGAATLIAVITKLQQIEIERIESIRKEEKENKEAFERTIKDQQRAFEAYNKAVLQQQLQLNAEIRQEWNKTSDSVVKKADSIAESIKDSFKDVGKAFKGSIKGIDKDIEAAKKSIDDLAKSSKDLIADLRNEIFREGLKDLTAKEQIRAIGEEIQRVEEQRLEKLKAGDVERAQELLKEQVALTKERIKLDRDRQEEAKKLVKEEVELRKKAKDVYDKLQKELVEAQKEGDKEATEKAKENIRELTDESIAELRRLKAEREKLEDDTIGTYVESFKEQYQELIDIQTQQQEQLQQAEKQRIDELTEYRKAKAAELAAFEAQIKGFTGFDLGEAISGAKTADDIDKIVAERTKAIQDVARAASAITDEQTRITVLQQLEQLEAQEQKAFDLELRKKELEALEKELKLRKELAEEERKKTEAQLTTTKATVEQAEAAAEILLGLSNSELARGFARNKPGSLVSYEEMARARKSATEFSNQLLALSRGQLTKDEMRRLAADLLHISRKLPETYKEAAGQLIDIVIENDNIFEKEKMINAALEERQEILKTLKESIENQAKALEAQAAAQDRYNLKLLTTEDIIDRMGVVRSQPIENKAAGGMIGYGSDTVPAMLTPGEFVMNAASTRKFYSQLIAMNSSSNAVQRFNGGGTVNMGDINVNMTSTGNESYDVQKIARGLRREIRRGTVSLGR